MSNYEVIEAAQARTLPAKDDRPEMAVDHYTLRSNGQQILATAFRRTTTPMPSQGQTLEGDLVGQDNFDKGRQKFKMARPGGGGPPRRRDPTESRRIERQHAQHMALLYIKVKAEKGWIEGFDFADVAKMADAFDRDLDPTPPAQPEYPGDDGGLPKVDDIG